MTASPFTGTVKLFLHKTQQPSYSSLRPGFISYVDNGQEEDIYGKFGAEFNIGDPVQFYVVHRPPYPRVGPLRGVASRSPGQTLLAHWATALAYGRCCRRRLAAAGDGHRQAADARDGRARRRGRDGNEWERLGRACGHQRWWCRGHGHHHAADRGCPQGLSGRRPGHGEAGDLRVSLCAAPPLQQRADVASPARWTYRGWVRPGFDLLPQALHRPHLPSAARQ